MAQQSISEEICVSYISREEEKLLSSHEIIELSRHRKPFPVVFRRHTRFIDLLQSVINYALAFELECKVKFLHS